MVDGEIEAAANAENSSGRVVMLKATDTVGHKKKVETDKANNDASDLDFAAGDVSLGGAMGDHQRQSIAEFCSWQAVQLSLGSSAPSNAANARGTGSPAKPVQASGKTGPPLAMQRSGAGCCARPRRH